MAREDRKKKGYEGFKLKDDTAGGREARLKRAQKNAQSEMTNEMFAASDQPFREACERAGVRPTARQASKFRGPPSYGAAARAAGKNIRKDPMGGTR